MSADAPQVVQPVGTPFILPTFARALIPKDFHPEECYRDHPRFQQLTDYLQGLVESGAFLPHEIAGAALLAGRRAEKEHNES